MKKGRWGFPACLLFAVALLPPAAWAAEFSLLPSVAEKVEYNDNIYIVPGNAPPSQKIHDLISTTSGGLELLSNTERASLDFTGRVDQLLYRENTNLDSTDQFYKAALRYSLSPRLSVSLRGAYDRDSRPDREFLTSGLILPNSARREVSSEGITADYALTDKTLASLSYDHGEYWYRSSHFVDMTYDAGTFSFIRDVSDFLKNTKARLTLGYARYNFTGMEVDNYEATTGFEYALQEKWTFLVDVGARYTESYFEALTILGILGPYVFVSTQNVTSTGTAGIGTARLSYKGELTTADLTAGRDVMPAYGSLGTVERTFVTAAVSRKFTYELSGSLNMGYYINKSKAAELTVTPFNYETFYATAGIKYEFSRDMYLEGSYNLAWVDNRAADTIGRRNLFLVRFFVQHRILQ